MKLIDTLSRIFNRNSTGELKHVTEALDQSITTLAKDVRLLDAEYIINQSTGEWIEEWGSWFGIRRLLNESDADYGNRIVAIVSNPKSTIPAIIDSTKSYLGDPLAEVSVYEPHVHVKTFNKSTFSGEDRFQDGSYYRAGVIDLNIGDDITPQLRETLNQIKSAGIMIYYTRIHNLGNPLKVLPKAESQLQVQREFELSTTLLDVPIIIFSESGGRSGRRIIWNEYLRETQLQIVQPPTDNVIHIDTERNGYAFPGRSLGAFRSRMTSGFSGHYLSPYDLKNPIPWEHTPFIFESDNVVHMGDSSPVYEREREKQLEITLEYDTPPIRDSFKETQMSSRVARSITATSEILLSDILNMTVSEVGMLIDDSLGSVQVEKLYV